jgi:hypothetical protein
MRHAFLLASAALLLSGCAVFTAPAPASYADREMLADVHQQAMEAEAAGVTPPPPPPPPAGAFQQPTPAYVDRFGGKLWVVLLDDKTHPSIRSGRSLWATSKEITYRPGDRRYEITVPKGFVTDLASIPRLFWDLLPPDGPWVKAAVIHDYLYYTKGSGVWKCHPRTIDRPTDYSKDESDSILKEAMLDRGVDGFRANVIWFAVHIGGGHGWDASPGRNDAYCAAHPPKARTTD